MRKSERERKGGVRDRERETLESGLIQTAPLGHLISVSIPQQLWEPDCKTPLTHFPLCSIRTGKLVGHCIHPIQASHNLSHSLERRAFGEVAWTLSGWFNCSHTQEVIHLTLTSKDKHIVLLYTTLTKPFATTMACIILSIKLVKNRTL